MKKKSSANKVLPEIKPVSKDEVKYSFAAKMYAPSDKQNKK